MTCECTQCLLSAAASASMARLTQRLWADVDAKVRGRCPSCGADMLGVRCPFCISKESET